MSQHFSAQIYKLGTYYSVDVPPAVSQAFGKRGYVPVAGTVNGQPFRGTLTPKGGGEHRLYLNDKLRQRVGVGAGATLTFVLALDEESRELPPPEDLAEALRENDLLDEFKHCPVGKRRHIITWLDEAKKEETRWRRIEVVARRMLESARRRAQRQSYKASRRTSAGQDE